MIYQNIRPIPYYGVKNSQKDINLAYHLRQEFRAKIARRFPSHYIKGFKADFIIQHVKKMKQKYPYFLRTDIAKFYPNIRHRDLIVYTQIAYRDLMGLDYVPKSFKQKYLADLLAWTKSLPSERGIPLGSPVSAILAPVLLVSLWIALKKRFNLPFIIYADDILVFGQSQEELASVYLFIDNYLQNQLDLHLNTEKTVSGKFSQQAFSFCGWEFVGGYSRISSAKIEGFKQRIQNLCISAKKAPTRAFIKNVNQKIDGFANYYKHGDVAKQFDELDQYIRLSVRSWLCKHTETLKYTNKELIGIGLHQLRIAYDKIRAKKSFQQPKPAMNFYVRKPTLPDYGLLNRQLELSEKVTNQAKELISLVRSQNRMLEKLMLSFQIY